MLKLKYEDKANLCYLDTDSLIKNIKTANVHKDIVNDVEERFDTSNYEIERPLRIVKNKFVGFVELGPKTYSYLVDDGGSDKGAKWIIEVYNKMET